MRNIQPPPYTGCGGVSQGRGHLFLLLDLPKPMGCDVGWPAPSPCQYRDAAVPHAQRGTEAHTAPKEAEVRDVRASLPPPLRVWGGRQSSIAMDLPVARPNHPHSRQSHVGWSCRYTYISGPPISYPTSVAGLFCSVVDPTLHPFSLPGRHSNIRHVDTARAIRVSCAPRAQSNGARPNGAASYTSPVINPP